jgi:hypothetical protein
MTRENLAFMGRTYQPFWADSGFTLDPPSRPSCSTNTKTDQTRGRSVALLTRLHPKCPFQVKLLRVRAFLLLLPSTGVLRSSRTIWTPDQTGQYGTLPIATRIPTEVALCRVRCGSQSRNARIALRLRNALRWPGTTSEAKLQHVRRSGQRREHVSLA